MAFIRIICPACNSSLRIPETGESYKKGRCPTCKEVIRFDEAKREPAPEHSEPEPPPQPEREYSFLTLPEMPDEIGRLGPYRVLGLLGAGGMGLVFRAEDPVLHRQIALKVMLPSLSSDAVVRARFLREARAVAAIESDHIVHIFQVGESTVTDEHTGKTKSSVYIAMPLLKGETLESRLSREGSIPIPETVRIARECADGLAAAHQAGLIHRDIKPANLWLEGNRQRVKILDFGLTKAAIREGSTPDEENLTTKGSPIGTPLYMAPEQGRGGELAEHRSDLFSLGIILYQMVTGKLPFNDKNSLSLLIRVATETPISPQKHNPQVSDALAQTIAWMMEKKVEKRPRDASVLFERLNQPDLVQLRSTDEIALSKADESQPTVELLPAPPASRTKIKIAILIVFAVILGALITIAMK